MVSRKDDLNSSPSVAEEPQEPTGNDNHAREESGKEKKLFGPSTDGKEDVSEKQYSYSKSDTQKYIDEEENIDPSRDREFIVPGHVEEPEQDEFDFYDRTHRPKSANKNRKGKLKLVPSKKLQSSLKIVATLFILLLPILVIATRKLSSADELSDGSATTAEETIAHYFGNNSKPASTSEDHESKGANSEPSLGISKEDAVNDESDTSEGVSDDFDVDYVEEPVVDDGEELLDNSQQRGPDDEWAPVKNPDEEIATPQSLLKKSTPKDTKREAFKPVGKGGRPLSPRRRWTDTRKSLLYDEGTYEDGVEWEDIADVGTRMGIIKHGARADTTPAGKTVVASDVQSARERVINGLNPEERRKILEEYMFKFSIAFGTPDVKPEITLADLRAGKFPENKNYVVGFTGFLSPGAYTLYAKLILHGISAYFARVNFRGGIHGKKLRIVVMDDGGNPDVAYENVKKMRRAGITTIIGLMGTRTLKKLRRDVRSTRIAIVFPWGGDPSLRRSEFRGFVFGPGVMKEQLRRIVERIEDSMLLDRVAVFYDDSSFGRNNLKEVEELMAERGVTPVASASYNRYTVDVESAAQELMKANPKVVICLATSIPTVELITLFFENGRFGTIFYGIDSTLFVRQMLQQRGAKFYYTSLFPDPIKASKSGMRIAKQYVVDSLALFPHDPINILSFGYYINAAILARAIASGKSADAVSVVIYLESMAAVDVGGFQVNFDPTRRLAYQPIIELIGGKSDESI